MQGVFSVLATPFRQGGDVDVESLRRYVEHFIGAGVTGFTALGVLGEAARLTERERALVLDTVLGQVNGRVPVVVGTTTEGLQTCLELSRAAQAAGATAVMVSPPRAPKLNSASVKAHFAALAEALDDSDRHPGLPAGVGLHDGGLAAGADRAGDSRRPDDQARGSADAAQDRASARGGRRHAAHDLRRPRRRVPARGTDGRVGRRDDRVRVPGDPGRPSSAAGTRATAMAQPTCSTRRCR